MLLGGVVVNRLSGPDLESPGRDRTQCNAGRPAPTRVLYSMKETGHYVNDQCNDHRTIDIGEQGMGEGYSSDVLAREIRIGDLKGHANGERQVGEVQIGGRVRATTKSQEVVPGLG
jgi:hypothetical protein